MNKLAWVDCRPFADFCTGHLKGAASLPATELFERMHELPRRQQPLGLLGTVKQLAQAEQFLQPRGYQIVEQREYSADGVSLLQQQGDWEQGAHSQRLWQPAPLLSYFIETLVPQYGIYAGKGLDLACGAGRDLVYLALSGWQMTGVDDSADALRRVQQLAALQQVTVSTKQLDLESLTPPLSDWAAQQFDLICVARYLHRPLFPVIRRLIKPGGILIYQTFMRGCEDTPLGRPRNPRFLLAQGELAQAFADARPWLDDIEWLEDGRPVSRFIAQFP